MIARLAPWVVFVLTAVFAIGHNYYIQRSLWIPDDAYISMRYAENFAAGKGLVYNEGERVEGYTTFLWVVLLSAGSFAGLNLETFAQTLGIVFSLGALLLTARAHRFIPGLSVWTSLLATVFLGTCGLFTTWFMAGMETPLVAFCCLLAVLVNEQVRTRPRTPGLHVLLGVCCTCAAMSRPDAGLIFAVLALDRFFDALRARDVSFLLFPLTFTVLFGAYFYWRYTYYGYVFPNTFYVKVGGTWAQALRGMDYTGRFLGAAFCILAPVLAAFLIPGRAFEAAGLRRVLLVIAALHVAYVTTVGGDFMPSFRFYASIFPLICLLAAFAVRACRPPAIVALLFTALVIGHNVLMIVEHRDIGDRAGKGNVGRLGKRVGEWLRENAPPDAVLATNTAGSIPFFSKLTTIDMLGLCDAVIAHRELPIGYGTPGHEKGDGRYVLSRLPDYVQFGSSTGAASPAFLGDRELYNIPEFRRDYELKAYPIGGGAVVRLYVRKAEAGGKPLRAKAPGEAPPRTRARGRPARVQ
ncbi:MAG: hypothetical protein KA184_13565 [Candidatus Hydrogenedentes bacterium]|nr:hypothetical protein [Candidatus Hydrogenedentota bacterium]